MNSYKYERLLSYFSRDVLSLYRASPHLYQLDEDDMGGTLEPIIAPDDESTPWFRVRFGFRRLTDGTVCMAAFVPDLKKLSEKDRLIWLGHSLERCEFATDDASFERWVMRNLEGSWEVEDGPKLVLLRELELICAITNEILGAPLWKYQANPLVNYPVSENTEAYYKAHLELYRLVMDGLDPKVIAGLGESRGIKAADPSRTLGNLRELLPPELRKAICDPLSNCRDQRNRNHGGLDKPPQHFAAFSTFHHDLVHLATGLKVLREWLEEVCSVDAAACLSRRRAFSGLFPKLIGPARPDFKEGELAKAIGKTILRVEVGEEETMPGVHLAEALVLHFTDGSAMCVRVGSNAGNLTHVFPGLKAEQFSTDLMLFWAPSGKRSL